MKHNHKWIVVPQSGFMSNSLLVWLQFYKFCCCMNRSQWCTELCCWSCKRYLWGFFLRKCLFHVIFLMSVYSRLLPFFVFNTDSFCEIFLLIYHKLARNISIRKILVKYVVAFSLGWNCSVFFSIIHHIFNISTLWCENLWYFICSSLEQSVTYMLVLN